MNFWTVLLIGLCSASLLFIQQSDHHTSEPEPLDKPNIFFLPETSDTFRARITLQNPFEDKIIGYRISTNQSDRVKITNAKTMSHGYILAKQQRAISSISNIFVKYSGCAILNSTAIKLEWVVLDPRSLNPDNTDSEALRSLFLTFGRATTNFKCREMAIRVPEVIRVPTPRSSNLLTLVSDLPLLTNLVVVFLLFLIANSMVSLAKNLLY